VFVTLSDVLLATTKARGVPPEDALYAADNVWRRVETKSPRETTARFFPVTVTGF
jgi:hypothetical protein